VLLRRRRFIATVSFAAAIVTALVMLALPNIFLGRALILPPSNQQLGSALASGLSQVDPTGSIAASAFKLRSASELYGGMLQSRTIADKIIEKFELQRVFEKETMFETRRILARRTSVTVGRDGLIEIEYEDEDPRRAADIANSYVDALEALSANLAISDASQRRLFLEKQVSAAKNTLAEAEAAFIKVQADTGLILPEQAQATLAAASGIRAQVVAKEVEVASLQAFATNQNPQLTKARRELTELRDQLTKLDRSPSQNDVFVSLSKLPDAGMAYLAKVREVRYNEKLFEVLARQLEMAKLEEAREGSTIQVVDRAVVPDRKSRPARTLWVLAVTFMVGFAACAVVLLSYEAERASSEDRETIDALRSEWRQLWSPAWLRRLVRRH
jgi:tyrosine-protein kinase Etk/Wzc